MRTLTISLFLLCTLVLNAKSQDVNAIKFGSEATLTLTKGDKGAYSYKITEVKIFHKTVNLDNDDFFKAPVDSNQVKLYFCRGGYDGEGDQTLLIIKSGLSVSLKYIAKISISDNGHFESTAVGPLMQNVKTVESWHFPLVAIVLSDFQVANP